MLAPIDPDREVLDVVYENGQPGQVPFVVLKAVFFPLLEGEDPDATGSRISVEFSDGEVIRGIANYNPERNGFFLFPYNRSKAGRVFVVNSAIVSIEVEKL